LSLGSNLIADQNEKIANIQWDLHNKVRKVERTASSNDPELEFWYDGTGNRVHKRVTLVSGAVKDEWYVRDPQGNEMAVYERVEENGFRVTRCKEHPIYGADRLGMDLNGVELSRYAVVAGDGDPKDPTGDPAGRHALVIAEIMYDSPTTGDDFPTGKEYNEGEYVVLVNKSGMDLDLADYKLHYGADSMALHDTLPAGERVIVAFGENPGAFGRIVALPAGLEDAVFMQNTLVLHDRGGIVSVSHASGAEIDAMMYGDFYGLSAENAYIADTLLDSMSRRSSLKSVQRASYGGASEREGSVGDIDPGLQTERSEQAEVATFYLNRGRKVYELKNHLGNVLAVVSDVKLGVSTSSLVDYYIGDVVEMTDYEPFGMQLASRHWVSGSGYRFGFNGKESDDEWNGEGNMVDFGARVYDSRLGRWFAIDPFVQDYPSHSPYNYALNNPIFNIDHGGKDVFSFLMKMLLEHFGFGSPDDISVALDNMGVEGDLRNGVAFLAGVAHSSTSLNVVDVIKGLATETPLLKAGRIIYKLADGENVVDLIVSEIPLASRYLQYQEKISSLYDTEAWGDAEWYKAGELLPMAVQDIAALKGLAEAAGLGKAKPTAAEGDAAAVASSEAAADIASQARDLRIRNGKNTIRIESDNPKIMYQYDLEGAEHRNVPTPHVQRYIRNVNPNTGESFWNKDNTWVRPMDQIDINFLDQHLNSQGK
jgi:RHS repeat-associated protein